MSLLADSMVWNADQMRQHAGRTVTYKRGGLVSDEFTAVASEMEYEIIDTSSGYATKFVSRDYWLLATDLILNGNAIAPRKGDRIIEMVNGVEQTFELLPLDMRPAAELLEDGQTWKAHTKRIGNG